MMGWQQYLALAGGLGVITVVISLGSVGSAVAQQSKAVLAQIVNDTRHPVPVVDVGGAHKTVVVFADVISPDTHGVILDVADYKQVRVSIPPGLLACTADVLLRGTNESDVDIRLGIAQAASMEPATKVFDDLLAPRIQVRTFGDCHTRRIMVFAR